MVSNKKIGDTTEKKVCSILRKKGFWVYNCPKSSNGSQPVDIIAIKGGNHYDIILADAKHIRKNEVSFPFDRIEPNQIVSLKYANDFAKIEIEKLGFAIEFERNGDIYWFPFQKYLEMSKNGQKSVNVIDLVSFEDFLNENDN